MTPPLPLADAFPVFNEDDWRAAVARTSRPAPIDPRDSVADGASAGTLHQRRVGARAIVGRAAGRPWRIVHRVDAGDASSAAAAVSDDVAGGATGVEIAFSGSLHPLGGRLAGDLAPTLAAALATVIPDRFHLRVDGPAAIAGAFLDLAAARKAELILTFDPIAALAIRGRAAAAPEAFAANLDAAAKAFDTRGIDGAVVIGDGRLWHAGGATEEQELAAILATFVHYLRLLPAARIGVALATDADQFRSMAKFRAMRLLLARVGEVAGVTSTPRVHGETAWRTMSARNPEMNILRATSATFAAAAGGADSIAVLPFDAVGGGDGHGRRLARNTQTILAEEAHLFRVADPGAGSGAIEALTATLAETAWKRFQAIEAEGGIVAAIGGGSLLREIAEARETRLARIAAGDVVMIGVNAYAGNGDVPAAARTRRVPVRQAEPLTFKRLSEPFEGHAK